MAHKELREDLVRSENDTIVIHLSLDSLIIREYTITMLDLTDTITKVDEKKIYNITEIRRAELFPWISKSNHISYVNAIIDDHIGNNLLKADIKGSGRGRDYKIKGKNIIKFLKEKSNEFKDKGN